MTSRSRRAQERLLRERDDRQRHTPRRARNRRLAWAGVLAQPLGIFVVLIANGLLVRPDPPRPEWPMLVPIGALAVIGLIPVFVGRARAGGLGEITGGLLAWGFAQSGAGIVAALVVRLIGGQDWAQEALFGALAGVLAAFALVVGTVLWSAGVMLVVALREARTANGWSRWAVVMISAGVSIALLGSLVLGTGGALAETTPTGGRRLTQVIAWSIWAFTTDETGVWVWGARVGAVLSGAGSLAGIAGTVVLAARGLIGGFKDRSAEPPDGAVDPGALRGHARP